MKKLLRKIYRVLQLTIFFAQTIFYRLYLKVFHLSSRRFKKNILTDSATIAKVFSQALTQKNYEKLTSLFVYFKENTPAPYSLAFGALLGSVLYERKIPWDIDIDIFCYKKDYNRIKARFIGDNNCIWKDHVSLGLRPFPVMNVSRLYWREDDSPYDSESIHIDIFWLMPIMNGYLDPSSRNFYPEKMLHPVQEQLFEGVMATIPAKPKSVLLKSYSNCGHVAVSGNPLFTKAPYAVTLDALKLIYPELQIGIKRFNQFK